MNLINKVRAYKKYPGVLQIRRWVNHCRSDVVIISFPKSGRTWLRALIGRALQNHYQANEGIIMQTDSICSLDSKLPMLYISHDDFAQNKYPEEISLDKSKYKRKKVIFLVRDPRDVLVSLYFHKSFRRGAGKKIEGPISDYLRERRGGIDSLITFYNVWAVNRIVPEQFLLIRYEDMISDARKVLTDVLTFMSVNWIPDEIINEAVEYSSFENLKKIEASNKLKSTSLKPVSPDNKESFKVRKGIVGGYKEYLNAKDIDYIENKIQDNLDSVYHFYK